MKKAKTRLFKYEQSQIDSYLNKIYKKSRIAPAMILELEDYTSTIGVVKRIVYSYKQVSHAYTDNDFLMVISSETDGPKDPSLFWFNDKIWVNARQAVMKPDIYIYELDVVADDVLSKLSIN